MTSHPSEPGQPAAHSDESLRSCLSDLADGQADEAGSQAACAAWRDRADMRESWHAYHLIGDVLRSEELARPAIHDAAFLVGLRAKLAKEPVVMAPMPVVAKAAQPKSALRPAWLVPTAAAAGFMAVAGVLVVTRLSTPDPAAADALQARSQSAPPPAVVVARPDLATGTAMIRDARLDAYVDAHRGTRGIGALALPGMGLRNAEVVVPAGNER